MDFSTSTCFVIATIVIQVSIAQDRMPEDPLVLNDFRSYALNLGGTLVDLLRKEILMLNKVSPPESANGGVPPAADLLPPNGLPGVLPQPPTIVFPSPGGSFLAAPSFSGSNIPTSGVTASEGSTVYSIGTNHAPLTVINIYGDVPQNTSAIPKRISPSMSSNQSGYPQPPMGVDSSNNQQNLESGSGPDINQNNTTPQQGLNNETSDESKNKESQPASAAQNSTDSGQFKGTGPVTTEQPVASDNNPSNNQNATENTDFVPTTAQQNTAPPS